MTAIKEMFVKDIERMINPVIKVADQDDEDLIFQELDEYVVTDEINKNLGKLYRGISDGYKAKSDSVGAWIAGDFGSGKSHFLKIVSYLLQNQNIRGKPAIEYLKDKVEVDIYQMLQALGRKNIQTVLFDIDAEAKEGQDSDDLVQTYLLVFNRMQGLSTNASVADMEKHLIEEGKYEAFKAKFIELYGKEWNEVRNKPTFYRDKIATALFQSGCFNEDEAKGVARKTTEPFTISAEDFSEMVKDYCKKKGPDFLIIFLVDEVGQFISENRQKILRLQTITEHLGIKCKGQAWNIVTSQEDVEAVVSGFKDMDFSKIQGRFSTRIKMSSTDVKEVIEKRVLTKKEDSQLELKAYYEANSTAIHNKLDFDNTVYIALYKNSTEFANTYPFVPYQYTMLQTMLTELRNKSRAGKNISNAARSMLKTFKDTVVLFEDKSSTTVIPMYGFFESLFDELDSPTQSVFINAGKNEKLKLDFDLNVLRTLFLAKYDEDIKTTITNITAMMVSDFNQNRIELKKAIEESLERLVSQNLVQRAGDCYIFLTNEEQEISQAIKRESVDGSKRIQAIANVAFTKIFDISTKYRYDANHSFAYNKYVDGENIDNTSYEIDIRINTPSRRTDNVSLAMESVGGVVIDLPPDKRVVDQFTELLATESYVRKCDSSELTSSKKVIVRAKAAEIQDMKNRATELLSAAIQNAKIYVNGSAMDIPETTPGKRLNIAMKALIDAVYHKMDLIRFPKSLKDIDTIFRNSTLEPFEDASGNLKLAFDEVRSYLQNMSATNTTVRMRNVLDKFTKKPFGFNDYDIEWIMAMLFRHNKIALTFDGATYEGRSVSAAMGYNLVTKTKDFDRIVIQVHESVSADSLLRANSICQELFNKVSQQDENAICDVINKAAKEKLGEIDGYLSIIATNPRYPGREEFQRLREILNNLATKSSPYLFKYIDDNEETLRDFDSRFKNLANFYAPNSARKALFEKGLTTLNAFEIDKTHLVGEIIELKNKIELILSSPDLKDLPQLNTLCKEADELIAEKIAVVKKDELDKLQQFYDTYKGALIQYPDLLKELETAYEYSEMEIETGKTITIIVLASDGFSRNGKEIIAKIPRPPSGPSTPGAGTPPTGTPSSSPGVPKRGKLYASACSSKISIDNEADIDEFLSDLRTKMREKLNEGPYDINW